MFGKSHMTEEQVKLLQTFLSQIKSLVWAETPEVFEF